MSSLSSSSAGRGGCIARVVVEAKPAKRRSEVEVEQGELRALGYGVEGAAVARGERSAEGGRGMGVRE
ncbi:MAG: hypothetical protein N3H31_04290 [Candidatus Nezhaarchaeota archaeon]|nr:hypothetical protein [Candidatus Nezhaarchaeota archaeon]